MECRVNEKTINIPVRTYGENEGQKERQSILYYVKAGWGAEGE